MVLLAGFSCDECLGYRGDPAKGLRTTAGSRCAIDLLYAVGEWKDGCDIVMGMTRDRVKEILERVLSWPDDDLEK
jgi:hypothetical protein